jgi:hypothetical protein
MHELTDAVIWRACINLYFRLAAADGDCDFRTLTACQRRDWDRLIGEMMRRKMYPF